LADFLKVRKAKRVGELTQTAFKRIEGEAKKANIPVVEAIEICCARGWAGFEAEWVAGGKDAKEAEKPDWQRGMI
jgi:hypothetical protein